MPLHRNLSGADLHDPKTHASSHQNSGSDEVTITGLSGKVADKQDPLFTHTDLAISPEDLSSIFQLLYKIEAQLNTLENRVSLLWHEAKRANTNFDLGGSF